MSENGNSYYSLKTYFQAGICFQNISSNTADNVICIYVRVLWSLIYIYNLEHKHWITMSCKNIIVFYIQLYYALVIQYVGSDLSLFCVCACVFSLVLFYYFFITIILFIFIFVWGGGELMSRLSANRTHQPIIVDIERA